MKLRYYISSPVRGVHYITDRETQMHVGVFTTHDQAVIRCDKLNEAWNAETRVQTIRAPWFVAAEDIRCGQMVALDGNGKLVVSQ